jgi:hypothetical protein
MDADEEQVEVASSADEEELKQAAQDHLDATVISYVLVGFCGTCCCTSAHTCLAALLGFDYLLNDIAYGCMSAGSRDAGPLLYNWCVPWRCPLTCLRWFCL